MIYLILYDITSDPIRTKVAKRLTKEGYERLQLSVFTGIKHPKKIVGLWQALEVLLKKEPSAKFYVLKTTKNNFKEMEFIGLSDLDVDYLTGTRNSLFI